MWWDNQILYIYLGVPTDHRWAARSHPLNLRWPTIEFSSSSVANWDGIWCMGMDCACGDVVLWLLLVLLGLPDLSSLFYDAPQSNAPSSNGLLPLVSWTARTFCFFFNGLLLASFATANIWPISQLWVWRWEKQAQDTYVCVCVCVVLSWICCKTSEFVCLLEMWIVLWFLF